MGPSIGRPVDINLLDGQGSRRSPAGLADAILSLLIVASLVMLIPVFVLLADAVSQGSAFNNRLVSAQLAMRQILQPPAEVVALRADIDLTEKKISKLDADLTALSGRRIAWAVILQAILGQSGQDVSLGNVQTDGRQVTVRGDAASLDAISSYVDRLRSTGYFANVVIEMVTSQGTPLPLPTAAPAPSPSVVLPSATPTPAAPTSSPTTSPVQTPLPTWTSLPTWAPIPTWAPVPSYAPWPPYPWPTATPIPPTVTPTPFSAVHLRNIIFSPTSLVVGGVLRVDMTVDNVGAATLFTQDQPPPGHTYDEYAFAPAGISGLWRVGVDTASRAVANLHRYRWGFGGALLPTQSRHIIGYIRLLTPGTFTYCAGVVQEFVAWRESCEGATTITVLPSVATPTQSPVALPSPSASTTPTRTATVCADGYEVDNTYPQARVIGANSSLPQMRNFHVAGDQDWVKFAVIPGNTYTMRTFDLRGGADTKITAYRSSITGTLEQFAQNDEDPANLLALPPIVGPSLISFAVTTTDTVTYGNTFYALINSPNPGNFGCDHTYKLSLTSSPTVLNESGVQLVRMLSSGAPSWRLQSESIIAASDVSVVGPFEHPLDAVRAAATQRIGFSIILEVRGGGP